MKIVIAEKPDQAKKLAVPFKSKREDGYIQVFPCDIFPDGAYFTWCIGHLYELQSPEQYSDKLKKWTLESLPIIPEQFSYSTIKGKSKQIRVINRLLKNSTEAIIGCDPAREGDYIGLLTIKMSGVKIPIKRLWTSSLTPSAVTKAFKNLLPESKVVLGYNEAQARSIADWLVGINSSRAYTILMPGNEVYSTGRVQTPLLSLIVQRDKEIAEFKATPYWEVFAKFNINGNEYIGKWFKKEINRIDEAQHAKALADHCIEKPIYIKDVNVERKNFEPPLLFNLSALQTSANRRFQFSPEKTLEISQKLYDNGFISYPRTDSQYVSEEEAKTFPNIMGRLSNLEVYKEMIPSPVKSLINNKRFVNPKEVSDHHAIIPTENVPDLNKLSKEERQVYDLIAKSLIAAHHENAIFDYTNLITVVDRRFTFLTKGKRKVQEGWRKIIFQHGEAGENDQEHSEIPSVKVKDTGSVISAEAVEKETKAPKRFTQGDLILLMKSGGEKFEDYELDKILKQTNGLGTEATRASIIKTLKDRQYIKIVKNKVYPTEKGRLLIQAIGDSILTSAKLTAQWEQRLKEIGEGKADQRKFIEQAKLLAAKLVEEAIRRLKENNIQPEEGEDKKDNNEQKLPIQTNISSALNSEKLNPTRRNRNEVVKSISDMPIGSCKLCKGDMVDKGNFFGCSNYASKGCGFTISKRILGKEIDIENIKLLLDTGETRLIEGFTHRSGNGTFKAVLAWDEEHNKLIFKTPNPNIYKMPTNLLKPLTVYEPSEEDTLKEIAAIEKEARAIKYPAKVVGVKHGPRITRYELLPDPGTNISVYKRFKANFQAALKAKSVSLYIPIPGTNYVGIEVPTKHPYPVQLRGLLENEEFQAKKKKLSFALGMDLYGRPHFANLADMPHLLVAGTTGSGKSVFLNSLILSLLYGCTPEELKFMFIDPKQVELSCYQNLPHLMAPITTDPRRANVILQKLISEMERRYETLAKYKVRNIESFNNSVVPKHQDLKKMPYIVLVIDELADLMLLSGAEVEDAIQRLAQLARAAGIHLVIATQRPTKKVISPIIKSNLPTRVSFAVAASNDSMTILDQPGAEELLGQGDMIYLPKDQPKLRLQSGFVSDEEIETVVNYLQQKYSDQVNI